MIRRFLSITFTACLCLSLGTTAHAQQDYGIQPNARYGSIADIQRNAHNANPRFEYMTRLAIAPQRPSRFDFTEFRRLYTETSQYDPMATESIDALLNAAFIMQNPESPQAYADALDEYQSIILLHLANLGVVMQAHALAKQDRRFGDPDVFQWIKQGLIRNLVISGDGNSLRGAYDVITMPEEEVLFQYIGMRPKNSVMNNEARVHYTMYTAEDAQGREHTVFVDTSLPMNFLDKVAEMRKGFSLRYR